MRSFAEFCRNRDTYGRFVEWMKVLGPSYQLVYQAHEESGGDATVGLYSGPLARFVLAEPGRYILGMSGGVSHAISAVNAGGKVIFLFDPNFGLMSVSTGEFEEFCGDY